MTNHLFTKLTSFVSENSSQRIRDNQKQQYKSQNYEYYQIPNDYWYNLPKIDPRDNKILFNADIVIKMLNQSFNDKSQMILRDWLIEVYQGVTSDAFYKFIKGELKQNEFKSYTAKNYLINIYTLMRGITFLPFQSRQNIFKFINKQSKEIIKSVILKYPQSDNKSGSRKFKKVISKSDNRQSDQFDLLRYISNFQYQQDADYSSQIMKTLNYIMQFANKTLIANDDESNFDGFNSLLEGIFTYAGYKDFQNVLIDSGGRKKYPFITQKLPLGEKIEDMIDALQGENKQNISQHRKKVLPQTHFKINQKIPNNAKLFSTEDIQSGLFKSPQVSILRVMAKWCEQLRDKIKNARSLILDRVEPFKNKYGELIHLNQVYRQYLYKAAQAEQKRVSQKLDGIQKQCLTFGSQMFDDQSKSLYTNKLDANVGILAARFQTCLSRYIFTYLNQLIHSLLILPKQAKRMYLQQKGHLIQNAQIFQSLSLITFKIGDLMRSKCISSQKHIISIYKFLQRISQECPNYLRIIRIKDRLQSKDNDILMNVFFMNKAQVEIQLSVNSKLDQKQQNLNAFNHYLYQLVRADFGIIAQSANIYACYDPVVKHYFQSQTLAPKIALKKRQINFQLKRKKYSDLKVQRQKFYNLPFYCSQCGNFSKNLNPQFYDRIHTDQFKQCNDCYEKFMMENNPQLFITQLINQRFKGNNQAQQIAKHFQIYKFKKGLQKQQKEKFLKQMDKCFIISKQSQKPYPQYAQILQLKSKIICVVTAQSSNPNSKSRIIAKLKKSDKWDKILQSIILLKINKVIFVNQKPLQGQTQGSLILCSTVRDKKLIQLSIRKKLKIQTEKKTNIQYIQNIYKQQKQILYIPQRQITTQLQEIIDQKNIKYIKKIYAFDNNIKNTGFLKKYINLEEINLNYNSINYLQGFANCTHLTDLKCVHNQIKDAQLIKNLQYIEKINFSQNLITDFETFKDLISLQTLKLNKNKIESITNLNKLKYLQTLQLNYNKIKKIDGLFKLQSLKVLQLRKNQIVKIEGLESLDSLQQLDISQNSITLIQNLNLKSLRKLKADSNKITSINNLYSMNQNYLVELSLGNHPQSLNKNKIKKIQNLSGLVYLQRLNLSHNQIQQISGLQGLKCLKQLNLSNNKIKRLQYTQFTAEKQIKKGFQEFTSLQYLYLASNNIELIENIQGMKSLRVLDLSKNNIQKIQNLNDAFCLTTLILQNNKIKEIDGIRELSLLSTLILNNNNITAINNVNQLKKLKKIQLAGNNIEKNQNNQQIIDLLKRRNTMVVVEDYADRHN